MSVFDKLNDLKSDIDKEIAEIDKQLAELKAKRKQLAALKRSVSPTTGKRRGRPRKNG